jgi:hypothetical protein
MRGGSIGSAVSEFEQVYRDNVGSVTAYFARRCADPQSVADLTSGSRTARHARYLEGDQSQANPAAARTALTSTSEHRDQTATDRDPPQSVGPVVDLRRRTATVF